MAEDNKTLNHDDLTLPNQSSSSSSRDFTTWTNGILILPEDQLLLILMLLPVQSILYLGMTCKRFSSLLSLSDTLWESLCIRDWKFQDLGLVDDDDDDASCSKFKKLYRRLHQLQFMSCRVLSLSDPDVYPGPRASHSLNFLSGSLLLLFGGGSDGGRHLDDTWIGYLSNDLKRILKWQLVNTGVPSGRFGHSCVVICDHLILFGGINDNGIRQNDTWVGEIAFHETLGVTLSWRLLDVISVAPPPRGAHAGCSVDNNRMLIHGGIGLSGLRLGDTWVLDIAENFAFGTWHEVVGHTLPVARSGHTLTYIGGTQTVLFGGRGLGYEVLNDVWLFDTSEGQLRWVQLLYELGNIPDGFSLPRVGHSATLILGGRVLIHGGEDMYRRRKNDFWVLDITARSIKMQSTSTSQRIGTHMWRRLKLDGFIPNGRSFHRACADNSGRYLYIFGGMVDGLLQPAEASGLRFDGEHFLVELVI